MSDTRLVDFIWQELCEIPDRSSPEDQPDMALVCRNDLLVIMDDWREREWRPIETAPKDVEILLGIGPDEEGLGAHVSQGYWIASEEDQVDQPGYDAGFVDCNYCRFSPGRSFGSEPSRYEARQPTHWIPLPSPPTT